MFDKYGFLRRLPRKRLKDLAFMYHYGSWRSERDARRSVAFYASQEMAVRQGYKAPPPHIMGEPPMTKKFMEELLRKELTVGTAAQVVGDYDLFLFDLDGTLISSYMDAEVKDFHKWEFLKGRTIAVNALRAQQKKVGVVTNQAGIDFGYNTISDWESKRDEVSSGFYFEPEDFFVCFAHPNGNFRPDLDVLEVAEEDSIPREWDMRRRKPSGAMILEAIEKYKVAKDRVVYVGDMDSDAKAAEDAGVAFVHADEFFA